jgi:hypothetical protein
MHKLEIDQVPKVIHSALIAKTQELLKYTNISNISYDLWVYLFFIPFFIYSTFSQLEFWSIAIMVGYIGFDRVLRKFGPSFLGVSPLSRVFWALMIVLMIDKCFITNIQHLTIPTVLVMAVYFLSYIKYKPYGDPAKVLKREKVIIGGVYLLTLLTMIVVIIFYPDSNNILFCFSIVPALTGLYLFHLNMKCDDLMKNTTLEVKKILVTRWIAFALNIAVIFLNDIFLLIPDPSNSFFIFVLIFMAIDNVNYRLEYIPNERQIEVQSLFHRVKRGEANAKFESIINKDIIELCKKIGDSSFFNIRNLLLWSTVITAFYSMFFKEILIQFSDDTCTFAPAEPNEYCVFEDPVIVSCDEYLGSSYVISPSLLPECSTAVSHLLEVFTNLQNFIKICFFSLLFVSLRSVKILNKYRIILLCLGFYFKKKLDMSYFSRIILLMVLAQVINMGLTTVQTCQYLEEYNGRLCKSLLNWSSIATLANALYPAYFTLLVLVYNNLAAPVHSFFREGDEMELLLKETRLRYEIDPGDDFKNLFRIRYIFKIGVQESFDDVLKAVLLEFEDQKLLTELKKVK